MVGERVKAEAGPLFLGTYSSSLSKLLNEDDITVLSGKRRQPDISRRSETGWTKNGKGANTRPPEEELHAHSEVK